MSTYSLINNCSHSEFWVSPANWKTLTSEKSLSLDWYVQCKYYDPRFKTDYPNGFPYRKRLNKFNTLAKRKAYVELTLKHAPDLFELQHFNPILKQEKYHHLKLADKDGFMPDPNAGKKETQSVTAKKALQDTFKSMALAKTSITVIASALKRIVAAIDGMGMSDLPVDELGRGNLKQIMNSLDSPPKQYNTYLSYLSMIFSEMEENELIDYNPAKMLRKKKVQKNLKVVITLPEIQSLLKTLEKQNYNLFRYVLIFFLSGARGTEMLNVKIKDVDLANQQYKATILKGRNSKQVIKVIMPEAVKYWYELINESTDPEQYIFGKSLSPEFKSYSSRRMSLKWYHEVNVKLGIKGGIYQLKHRMLSEINKHSRNDISGLSTRFGDHDNAETTNKFYLIDKEDEQNDELKKFTIGLF